ncbi:MAG TPA: ribbon-helix-helix protein, CopG family [Opitutaceae bacterium]|nr:ribbon-helix-helix protein, CopG family [Opitutaceae bacterium]
MAVKKSPTWAPLTFDLTQPQAAKIETARRLLGFGTQSEVVRTAIGQFDFASYEARRPVHRQISVRLAPELREKLRQHARRKNVSIGELLRVALERLVTSKVGSKSKARK